MWMQAFLGLHNIWSTIKLRFLQLFSFGICKLFEPKLQDSQLIIDLCKGAAVPHFAAAWYKKKKKKITIIILLVNNNSNVRLVTFIIPSQTNFFWHHTLVEIQLLDGFSLNFLNFFIYFSLRNKFVSQNLLYVESTFVAFEGRTKFRMSSRISNHYNQYLLFECC